MLLTCYRLETQHLGDHSSPECNQFGFGKLKWSNGFKVVMFMAKVGRELMGTVIWSIMQIGYDQMVASFGVIIHGYIHCILNSRGTATYNTLHTSSCNIR